MPLLLVFSALVWVLSLIAKDASIVDRFWALGFLASNFFLLSQSRFLTFRGALIFALVAIWAIRLSLYIHLRNRGRPEDPRYQKMRHDYNPGFWWKSLFLVFGLQAFLAWAISAPFAVIHLFPQSDTPTLLDGLGITLWLLGFLFESIGDWQLARFKRDPLNRGKVCRTGLWSLTRHPNYFGESLVWWGFFLIASNARYGVLTVFSPILMTYLLLRVSGVAHLERRLVALKPEYADYIKEVPAFLPLGWWRR